jgi:hypothetical protein
VLPSLGDSASVFSPEAVRAVAQALSLEVQFGVGEGSSTALPVWQSLARVPNGSQGIITWALAGTLPDWNGVPLALALVLEEDDPVLASQISQSLMQSAIRLLDASNR